MRKGDTVFYVSSHNIIVQAVVKRAHKDGSAKVEACRFFYDGKTVGPYIGQRFELAAENLHVSALAADYAIQAKRGLTL
jgi:hypothetical protein